MVNCHNDPLLHINQEQKQNYKNDLKEIIEGFNVFLYFCFFSASILDFWYDITLSRLVV